MPPSAFHLYSPACLHMFFFALMHLQRYCSTVYRWCWRTGREFPSLLVLLTLKQSCICLVAAYTQILATAMLSANAHRNSQLWSFIQTILWQFTDAHLFLIKPSHSVMYCLQPSGTEVLLLGSQFGLIK